MTDFDEHAREIRKLALWMTLLLSILIGIGIAFILGI
jgi:hypothetical protein